MHGRNISTRFKLNDGRSIPIIGLGTWNIPDGQATEQAVKWALEHGYRHIDTAKFYKNEVSVGKAVREYDIVRADVWVTTKLWPTDFKDPKKGFASSFSNLDIEYIDLYLIHWPTPVEIPGLEKKIWRALESLVDEGLCKSIGVSNYGVKRLNKILGLANIPPAVNQIKCSPYKYPKNLHEFCRQNNIAVTGYSPLARGRGLDNPLLQQIGQKHSKSPAQVMLRWALQKDIIVIPKSVHKERIVENANIFDFELSQDDMSQLDEVSKS